MYTFARRPRRIDGREALRASQPMALAPVQTMFKVPLAPAGKPLGAKVELLAPAGSIDALVAAVENGADAVYLAGQHFGARKFAKNFSGDELRKGIDFAHVRGVKVFV